MYKFLILLLVFVSVDCRCRNHRSNSCKQKHRPQRYNNNQYEKIFNDITSNVISSDLKYYEFCDGRNTQIREYYGVDFYTLKYTLPEYEEKNITVKLKHRVIYLNGQKQSGQIFRDIRILPQMVKAREGQWFKESDDIVLQFPYKTTLKTETMVSCDAVDKQLHKLNRLLTITNEELRSLDSDQTNTSGIITFDENTLPVQY